MVSIKDAVVIGRRVIVTQADAAPVHTVDVPTLGIILTHTLTGIVANPRGDIVIGEVEEVGNTFLTTYEIEYGCPCIGTYAIVQIIDVVGNINDTVSLV